MSYQAQLLLRLASGAASLPEELRGRHAAYLARAQRDDGGFPGRQGASDLYYTSFALRGLAMLGTGEEMTVALRKGTVSFSSDENWDSPPVIDSPVLGALTGEQAGRAADFLAGRLAGPLSAADFVALVTSSVLVELATGRDVFAAAGRDRRQAVEEFFAPFRRSDGGYSKTSRGAASSTYQTFLVVLCKQLVEAPLDGAEQMTGTIRARQRDDGGFVEIEALRQSGSNPTAAAVALLRVLGGLDDAVRTAAASFLAGMQTAEGGLRAHARIPLADLLSTFTGLATLADLDALGGIDVAAARGFVQSLDQPSGGYCAAAWDTVPDVEYTFYGLGSLALLPAAGIRG